MLLAHMPASRVRTWIKGNWIFLQLNQHFPSKRLVFVRHYNISFLALYMSIEFSLLHPMRKVFC